MNANRFDVISNVFAKRRLSRREALAQGGAGLAAGVLAAVGLTTMASAQDATPEATTEGGKKIDFLFVQTYQSGTIAPVEGVDGRYTLSLEAGSGQTVYFSDRPDRIVGAGSTPLFLEGLGFPADNPPNAALVVETAPGETDIAVVELFAPLYDPISQGVTYEIEVLANWEDSLEMGFHEAPTDLAALAPAFGSAQLFIDDCADWVVRCQLKSTGDIVYTYPKMGFCFSWSTLSCNPCEPYYHQNPNPGWTEHTWDLKCNNDVPACGGACFSSWL